MVMFRVEWFSESYERGGFVGYYNDLDNALQTACDECFKSHNSDRLYSVYDCDNDETIGAYVYKTKDGLLHNYDFEICVV
ncbi:hypothetical protein J6Q66_05295 [bacterium]|nr:hypothetical protein [bacterium]